MSIEQWPLTDKLVGELYELVCTPFELACFRERWDRFGWSYEPRTAEEFGFEVQVPAARPLSVDPLGAAVVCARLPFCYWEDYDGESGRQAFDEAFEAAAECCRRLLPAPVQSWMDADSAAHRAIVWEGDHGLLILQQACFDPQFGLEIDFWLTAGSQADLRPTTPLIDWLCHRSRARHAERGYPPVRW